MLFLIVRHSKIREEGWYMGPNMSDSAFRIEPLYVKEPVITYEWKTFFQRTLFAWFIRKTNAPCVPLSLSLSLTNVP
jgi:hypothetical protein